MENQGSWRQCEKAGLPNGQTGFFILEGKGEAEKEV